jgi:peptidoglycan-associated lipoprotein
MSNWKIAAAVAAGGLWLSGCATQDYVDRHVAELQSQVSAAQDRQRDNEAQLAKLDHTTREALERAEAAGKLSVGRFDYSVVLSDETARFPTNGSTLSPQAEAKLTDLVAKLKADNKPVYLEIQGYTDATGTPAANMQLGADRAEAVRRFLNRQGVALNRMATISYGEDSPVAPNTTRDGRAQNRRVVLVILE